MYLLSANDQKALLKKQKKQSFFFHYFLNSGIMHEKEIPWLTTNFVNWKQQKSILIETKNT